MRGVASNPFERNRKAQRRTIAREYPAPEIPGRQHSIAKTTEDIAAASQ
jgi:hypothetical protein